MPNMFLLFSHSLTDEQLNDAQKTLRIQECISLPEELQARWSDVPPELEMIDDLLQPLFDWLLKEARPGDFLLVQGDFGVVYLAVTFAFAYKFVPVYATTQRKVMEKRLPDGKVQVQRMFQHVRYRRYSQGQFEARRT